MDAKLAEFRARRRRQELIESAKATVQNILSAGVKAKENDSAAMNHHERAVRYFVKYTLKAFQFGNLKKGN
jgi:hypothetical protein